MRGADRNLHVFGWVSAIAVRSVPWTNMASVYWAIVTISAITLAGDAVNLQNDPVKLALDESKGLSYTELYMKALVRLDMENTININNQPMKLFGGDIEVGSNEGEVCNNTIVQTKGIPWEAGNSSMHFNSSASYVAVNGTTDSLEGGISVSLWIKKPEEGEQSCTVMDIEIDGSSFKLKRELSERSGKYGYGLYAASEKKPTSATFNEIWEWNMISFTINETDISIFENGAFREKAEHGYQPIWDGTSNLTIGLTLNGVDGGCTKLEVDEVALWNRVLNMSEFIALRVQPFNANCCKCYDPDFVDYRDSVENAELMEASDSLQQVNIDSTDKTLTADEVGLLLEIVDSVGTRDLLSNRNLTEKVKQQNRKAFVNIHGTVLEAANDPKGDIIVDPVKMIEGLESALSGVYFSDEFGPQIENFSTPYVEAVFQTIDSTKKVAEINFDGKLTVTIPFSSFGGGTKKVFVMVYDEEISSLLVGVSDSRISTHILSIQLSSSKASFTEPIYITFPLDDLERTQVANNTYTPKCSYLNLASSEWKVDGLETTPNKTTGIVTCKADHLTNFAVLLSPIDLEDNATLSALTYILLTISMICLLVTFLVLMCLREVGNTQRVQILKHFIAALFVAQALFVFTTELMTFSEPLCKVSAVLSHYFWVATFTWMLVQGVQLYTKVRRLVGGNIKQLFYVLFAWGFPLPVAVIPILLFREEYTEQVTGPTASCWIPPKLIWFLAVPLLVIFCVNLGVTVLVMRTFLTVKVNKDKSNTEKLKSSMRAVIVMVPVLGLTWAFGLLLLLDQNQFFQYLFVILNSLQGVFVFLFHLVMNEDVRSAVLRRRNKVASSAENTIFTKVPRNKIGEQSAGIPTDTTKAPLASDSSSNL